MQVSSEFSRIKFWKINKFEENLKDLTYFKHVYDVYNFIIFRLYRRLRFSKYKADWETHPILRESEYFAGKARKPSRLDTSEISRTHIQIFYFRINASDLDWRCETDRTNSAARLPPLRVLLQVK